MIFVKKIHSFNVDFSQRNVIIDLSKKEEHPMFYESQFRYSPQKSPISVKKITKRLNYTHKDAHMHHITELLLVSSHSNGVLFNNGNRQELTTPALILHRAGSYHYIDTSDSEEEGYSCHCIYFNEQFVKQIPENLLHSDRLLSDDCLIIELNAEECARLETYAELLEEDGDTPDPEKGLFLLLLILNEAYRLLSERVPYRLNTPNNYIFDVVQYLIQHFNEPLTTNQIADLFHVSVSKINTDFHRITNQSLKEFYNNLRILRATDLLMAKSDTPIVEIAYRCGFSSESYFIQSFQKSTGLTPNAYRKKHCK